VGKPAASRAVEFIWALVITSRSPLLEAELAHALARTVNETTSTPGERRVADLHLLRELIDAHHGDFPPRDLYDAERREGNAPTSHTLLAHHGSWWEACSIAARMREDGTMPPGRTFSGGGRNRGRAMPKAYTLDELVGAVRLCAFSLGRRPTTTDYLRWNRATRHRAQERGVSARIPCEQIVYRLVRGPSRWAELLALAAITDRELQQARAILMGTPVEDETTPFLSLPLGEALRLAAELGGSLDWLAGRTVERSPGADPQRRFNPDVFRELRDRVGAEPERIRQACGLTIGQSRRLLTGTYEPTLGQLVDIASLLGVTAAYLCTTAS
jgi:hypothetical protein